MKDPRSLWDSRSSNNNGMSSKDGRWILPMMDRPETPRKGRVLDIGCGAGGVSRCLTDLGFEVVSIDLSGEALLICGQVAPQATRLQVDIRHGLPFEDGSFAFIVANLSLHYFYWSTTGRVLQDVRRCLTPGGILLVQLNSTKDVNHGAVGHEEIEPGFYLVNGERKRFFDQDSIDRLFKTGWEIQRIQEVTEGRFRETKVLWELVLEKG